MLKVENVGAGYRGRVIVSNINFELVPGSKIVVIGSEKCGKSTLLKTVAGLIPPILGKIYCQQGKICFIPQDIDPQVKTTLISRAIQENYSFIIADEPFAFLSDYEINNLYTNMLNYKGGLLISETRGVYREGFNPIFPTYKNTACSEENAVYM